MLVVQKAPLPTQCSVTDVHVELLDASFIRKITFIRLLMEVNIGSVCVNCVYDEERNSLVIRK